MSKTLNLALKLSQFVFKQLVWANARDSEEHWRLVRIKETLQHASQHFCDETPNPEQLQSYLLQEAFGPVIFGTTLKGAEADPYLEAKDIIEDLVIANEFRIINTGRGHLSKAGLTTAHYISIILQHYNSSNPLQ